MARTPPGAQYVRKGNEEVNGEEDKISHESNAIMLAKRCKTARSRMLALLICEFAPRT
jgi:hypothetical protein